MFRDFLPSGYFPQDRCAHSGLFLDKFVAHKDKALFILQSKGSITEDWESID